MVHNMVDIITSFVSQMYIPLFNDIALILETNEGLVVVTVLIIFLTTYFFKQKRNVLPVLLITLLLSVVFAVGTKEIFKEPRLCDENSKVACPEGYGFPSTHAALGFALLLPAIGTPGFWVYLVFSVVLAFSRIYLGVHTLFDIVGSMGIAIVAYTISKIIITQLRLVAHEFRI